LYVTAADNVIGVGGGGGQRQLSFHSTNPSSCNGYKGFTEFKVLQQLPPGFVGVIPKELLPEGLKDMNLEIRRNTV